jgi:hypothetical protein
MMTTLLLAAQLTLGASTDTLEGVTSDGKFIVGATSDWNGFEESNSWWYEPVGGDRTSFSEEEKAAFEAWRAKVKVVPVVAGRTSPDGKTTIDVVMKPKAAAKADEWINTSEVTVIARTGERKLELFQTSSSFDVAWTADARALIITLREPTLDHGPRGSVIPSTNVQIMSWVPTAPSVNVLGPTRKLAMERITDQFAGTPVNLRFGAAVKRRARTVLYCRKDQEAFAKKIASKFTGSTIEPLTWDSPFDLVVALGGDK